MRHTLNVLLIILLSFVLSIAQFFITGVYGRLMFWPIAAFLLMGYLVKYSLEVKT